MSNLSIPKLVTKADAAAAFGGVCTKTIDNYIRAGLLPQPVQFASREYWHPAVFAAFMARTFGHTEGLTSDHAGSSAEVGPTQEVMTRAPARNARPKASKEKDDSSAVVRQQTRQQARLRAMNGGR